MSSTQKSAQPRLGRRARSVLAAKSASERPAADGTSSSGFDFRRAILPCAILAFVTVLLYGSVTSHPFLNYDDEGYITRNLHVRGPLGWQTVEWAFTSTDMANWHPITWLSHILDYQLFGDWAGGHHLTSLILHVVNVLILFRLLARISGSLESGFWVALLFAVHPMNVESVAWVAERKNLLCTLFFFLVLGAYGRYARRPSIQRYLAVAALFAFGLASKPMLVTLPFVLLLLDYWPLQRIQGWTQPSTVFPVAQFLFSRLLMEKFPLLILSATSSLITIAAQSSSAIATDSNLSFAVRLENAVYSYAMYIAKAFWPAALVPIYPHPGNSLSGWQVGLCLVFLLAVTGMVWQSRRSRPYLVTGWLWYLGTLVPVIGLVQVGAQGMADRYAYIPLIGIFVMLVWGATDLVRMWKLQLPLRAACIVAATALWIVALQQVRYWNSPYDLWSHTLTMTTNNYIAEDNMATTLLRMGNKEALVHFQNASRISPNDPVSHGAIAGYLQDQGRLQEAIPYYQIAIRGNSDPELLAVAEANLAVIYRQIGDYGRARETYRQAAATDPQALEEMRQNLISMLSSQPSAPGLVRLGLLFDVANQTAQARSAYQQVLQMDPGSASAKQAQLALNTLR